MLKKYKIFTVSAINGEGVKEVVKELWKRINEAIETGRDVFIDQTSLTKKSRPSTVLKIFISFIVILLV